MHYYSDYSKTYRPVMLPDHVNVPLVVPVVSLKVAGRTGVVKLKNSWLVEKSSLSSDKGLTELF